MIIISPAKRQQTEVFHKAQSHPRGIEQAINVLKDLQSLTQKQTQTAMTLSDRLAEEAWEKNQAIDLTQTFELSAIDLYQGDVYASLDAASLDDRQVNHMNANVRIISALYGLLKPLDGVSPYRLEMATQLPNHPALAKYWLPFVTNQILAEQPQFIFNLASKEYSACLGPDLRSRVVDIVIQDVDRNGEFKVIAVKAKRMRGQILRFMVQNKVTHPEQLLESTINGYHVKESLSNQSRIVFRPR